MTSQALSRKRVLILCTDLGYGGAEASFAKVSRLLAQYYDVVCVAFNSNITQHYTLGGDLQVLDEGMQLAKISAITRLFHRVRRLKQIKKKYQIDVSISFLEGADYVNFLAADGSFMYASIRGTKIYDGAILGWKGWLRKRLLMRWIYPRFDGIVTVSRALKQELEEYFNVRDNKVHVIYNFYDAIQMQQFADESLPESVTSAFSEFPVITNVGRLHIQKNQEALLHIISIVAAKVPNVRLALIGDGPLEKHLFEVCRSIGLTYWAKNSNLPFNKAAQVWFFGYQANPHAYTSRSKFFAFPSSWEGFPNALVEAMLCKVPVVSSDCPTGPREILAPGLNYSGNINYALDVSAGVLATIPKVNDTETISVWVDAFLALLSQNELNDLRQNAYLCASVFTEDAITPLWQNLIEMKR